MAQKFLKNEKSEIQNSKKKHSKIGPINPKLSQKIEDISWKKLDLVSSKSKFSQAGSDRFFDFTDFRIDGPEISKMYEKIEIKNP